MDTETPYFELAVQKSPLNPAAAYLWGHIPDILDATLHVRVGGSFTFPPREWKENGVRNVVFVAGGVGINPIICMIGSIVDQQKNVNVEVLYSSKIPKAGLSDVLFAQRMGRWAAEGQLKGRLRLFATDAANLPADEVVPGLEICLGRMSKAVLVETVEKFQTPHDLVYICGPPTMTDELVALLTSEKVIGIQQVQTERWW